MAGGAVWLKSQSLSWMVRNRRALDSFMEMEQNCCLPASLQRKLACQSEDKLCLFIPTRSPALPETCAPNLSVYNITLTFYRFYTMGHGGEGFWGLSPNVWCLLPSFFNVNVFITYTVTYVPGLVLKLKPKKSFYYLKQNKCSLKKE